MSLPLPPTLSEVRNSVMIRAGAGAPSPANLALQSQVDELIRSSQIELYYRAEWLRGRGHHTFALTANVSDYNVPDDCDAGNIARLWIVNNKGTAFAPKYDELIDFHNEFKTASRPRFWYIIDGVIRFTPAPDATWLTADIDYTTAVQPLVNDADRISVDGEALIQWAAIKLRETLGIGAPSETTRRDFEVYLERLRMNQGPGQMFTAATRLVDGPAYWDRARTVPYTPDWNPPGSW